jgi:hypothetical protein
MEELTFGTCVKNSWISTWQSIARMPGFFLCIFAVLTCTTLLSGPFQHLAAQGADVDIATKVGQPLVRLVCSVLQLVVYGFVIIKVNRHLLLGEGSQPLLPLNGEPLGRYMLFSLGLAVVMIVVTVVVAVVLGMIVIPTMMHSMREAGFAFLVLFMVVVYLYTACRLCLIYPAVSLGSQLTLRAAWKDSRGHFWSILGVGFVAHLPLTLIWMITFAVIGARELVSSSQDSVALAVVFGFINTVFIGLAASVLSWLYRRYANALLDYTVQ